MSASTTAWSDFWVSASTTINWSDILWEWTETETLGDLAPTEKSVHGLQLKGKLRLPHIIGKIKPQRFSRRFIPFSVMSRGFEDERQR